MIQEGLYALLAADAGVAAICGGNIYPAIAPDDLAFYPCIAYSSVGGSSEPSFNTSGMVRQRVEISCYAVTYKIAAELRAAVIAAVNGWQQRLTDGTNVSNTVLLNPGTDFCSEQRIFRCMVEFYVLYTLSS